MRTTMRASGLTLLVTCSLLSLAATSGNAQEKANAGDEVVETIEVQRAESRELQYPSLRFLRDNRVFIRGQLDRLKMRVTRERTGSATSLDARYLWLKELSAAIAAANDTLRVERADAAADTLLESVTELSDLDATLRQMELLLAEQRSRLLALEQDFLGRQETSLVILVKGMTGHNPPASIVVGENNEFVRIDLTPGQRASLEQGGIAQIFHEFVEPRDHDYIVSFIGGGWNDEQPLSVRVVAERDRMTFLELDASQLNRNKDAMGLLTSVWYR